MLNKDDAEVGQTVYPRPTTKLAIRECYLGLAAVLVSMDRWPMVEVRIFDDPDEPGGRILSLHKDNVGLTRRTVKRETGGDTTQDHDTGPAMVGKVLPGKPKLIDPGSGYEDGMLF